MRSKADCQMCKMGIAFAVFMVLVFFATYAFSDEKPKASLACPPDAKTCKVLIITPDEEQVLVALVSNTGAQGPYNMVKSMVDAWLKKIADAPAGEPRKDEKK